MPASVTPETSSPKLPAGTTSDPPASTTQTCLDPCCAGPKPDGLKSGHRSFGSSHGHLWMPGPVGTN